MRIRFIRFLIWLWTLASSFRLTLIGRCSLSLKAPGLMVFTSGMLNSESIARRTFLRDCIRVKYVLRRFLLIFSTGPIIIRYWIYTLSNSKERAFPPCIVSLTMNDEKTIKYRPSKTHIIRSLRDGNLLFCKMLNVLLSFCGLMKTDLQMMVYLINTTTYIRSIKFFVKRELHCQVGCGFYSTQYLVIL